MMINPETSFLKSIQHDNATPLWSGYVVWANYHLDVNVFPRSRNSHLNEWGSSNAKDLFSRNPRIQYNADFIVNIQIIYTKPSSSWNSSSAPLITEEVKNAFFGDSSSRQSVHIVMKMTSTSSHFVSHIEATNAYISGFAFVPAQKGEAHMPLHPLRPLVIDLNTEKVVRCGEYFYFKAWILNENFILPFYKYACLKNEPVMNSSPHPLGVPFHTPHHPPPSGLPPYYSPSMSRALPSPYSKLQSHFQSSSSSGGPSSSASNFYDLLHRQQSQQQTTETTNKYIQNSVQKPSQSSVIKPIAMYPYHDSSQNSAIHFRPDQQSMKDLKKKPNFSSDSVFKAHLQSGRSYSGPSERFHPSQSDSPDKKLSNLRIYSPKGPTATSSHQHQERTSNNSPVNLKTRASHSPQTSPPPLSSQPNNSKTNERETTTKCEKYLSEFVNTLFSWQEDINQTLNLLDKVVPLLISSEYEDKILLEKVHDLFNTFYKGQKGNIPQEYEKWEVKIELQFANTLKKCPYNFKQDLATHLLKERDTLLMNQKKKERKLKKRIFEATIKTEEHTMKRKTIGVFSGNFNEKLVHFNTVILENVSVPPSFNYNFFSNLYCLFIAKDISLFPWDKWKDNKVLISTSHSKMSAAFYLDDSNSSQFNLPVKFMEHSEDFHNYISTEKDSHSSTEKKACLISFTNFYHYFQKIEKVFKIEPLITWKPIIFSKTPGCASASSTSTSSSQMSAIQKSKEQDPFYGLLMTVFGNRVYGLSYRKRIKLKFEFGERNSLIYHALIFNNNIVFISEETALNFLLEIDNLIFGCESFETFLIKNDRIPTNSNSVLKLKIPITSRKVPPPKDSLGNNTSIIPNVLIKAKILNHEQLNNLEFLKKEIFEGESFIVERKQSLIIFQNTLKGHIKSDENYDHSSIIDFRMMRKIRAIAKMRVVIRNVYYDLIIFYFVSFMKSEGSELVFVNNSENEIIGRSIDVLISPLTENTQRLVSKSNFSSSVLLTRKDKSTWAMITDINEPIRCISRIIMPNTFKNIIWEAIKCKDMFFSDMENIRCAFSSSNKVCTIKSWEKLYGVDDQSFKDLHQSKETLEPWDNNFDAPQNPIEEPVREEKKYKRPSKKKSQDEKYFKSSKKMKEDEIIIAEVDAKKEEITNPIKKRKIVFQIFDRGATPPPPVLSPPLLIKEVEQRMVEPNEPYNILQSIPLKKRLIRANSPSSTLSSSSPTLTIDIDEEYNDVDEDLNENLMHIKDEPHFSPKVIIPERDRIEADSYLNQREIPIAAQENDEDEEVINVIKCIVSDIEQSGSTKSNDQ